MGVIDLSLALDKARPRVRKIGIELEGGWKRNGRIADSITRDSSVRFERLAIPVEFARAAAGDIVPEKEYARYISWYHQHHPEHVGELPSPAMSLFEASKTGRVDLKKPSDFWKKWLTQHWPEFINKTCGMHTHMSFENDLTYQRLMTVDYQDTILEYIKRWALTKLPADHHIFERIEGKSEYCQRKFMADKQVLTTRKDYDHHRDGCRYTAVHYCWGRYKTVELRFLPMMPSKELAIEVISECLRVTNAFLLASRRREPVYQSEWLIDEPTYREEIIACV